MIGCNKNQIFIAISAFLYNLDEKRDDVQRLIVENNGEIKMSKKIKIAVDQKSYIEFLDQLKKNIQQARLNAVVSITKELILLYWRIGNLLSQKIIAEKWGSKTIELIAKDLSRDFPGISGFSYRNLHFMRQFADYYPDGIYETAVSQIPWGHNIILMQKISSACPGS